MITKLNIDNYKCFTNFELALENVQLFFGINGVGKTSAFDLLEKLRALLLGVKITDLFYPNDLTLWDKRLTQDFAFDLQEDTDHFRYELQIEHEQEKGKSRISREQLTWKDTVFYRFENGEVHLYRQNRKSGNVEEGTSFSFDWTQSFIPLIPERDDNKPLIRFRNAVGRWVFIGIAPFQMATVSEKESLFILRDASNYSSWYQSLTQTNPEIVVAVRESLQDAIPYFEHLKFLNLGELKALQVIFDGLDRPLSLHQLSDGQRVLIVLYTILAAMRSLKYDLFIDEPDNYVGLREIQPWLHALQDTAVECSRQAVIISHHPEVVNVMAGSNGKWFSRKDNGPVRAGEYPAIEGLTTSATMARGWDEE